MKDLKASAHPMIFRLAPAVALLVTATQAAAKDVAQVSEASSFTLLALGVAGVVIGRHLSRGRKNED
ncbi:MAG: hypothetical protein WA957_04800 [Alteraurantiacibacter sp.]